MKKYFLKDGDVKQGPFNLAELATKSITTETAIWYEGLPEGEWTTAGKINELKDLFTPIPTPTPTETSLPTVNEVKAVDPTPVVVAPTPIVVTPDPVVVEPTPVVTTTTTAATTVAAATPAAAKTPKPKPVSTGKKSSAWISWVAMLLVLGGAGYFIYQDMEKNKTAGSSTIMADAKTDTASTTKSATTETPTTTTATDPTTPDTAAVATNDPATTTTTNDPAATTTTTTTTTPNNTTAQQTAAQKKADADKKAAAKKADDDKKKQAAIAAQKKADADKKKMDDAKAAADAREKDQRNRWMNYISFGKLNYSTEGEGIKAFDVPVYNGTDGMLNQVTVRIEYRKKEKKIYKTETITIYNIPARSTGLGKAPDSKRGEIVNVFITAIHSKKLHFCYPENNGNADDPYLCN